MSGRIEVGDLVRVAHWPCCDGELGKIFHVERIWSDCTSCTCLHCGTTTNFGAVPVAGVPGDIGAAVPWLRRIPPLAELESQDETAKEPA